MLYFLVLLSSSVKNIVIARSGEVSPYQIVIPSNDPLTNHNFAAKQFRNFVINITGVELKIIKDNEPLPEKAILIGMTKYSKKITNRIKEFGEIDDAFHILCSGDYLLINGDNRTILYGIFELFERYANFRFYSSWMHPITKSDTFELPSDLDLYHKGSFFYRESYDPDLFRTYLLHSYMRYDSGMHVVPNYLGGEKIYGTGCHTIFKLMKGDQYPQSKYPERYALKKDGKSRSTFDPCLSNEDVYKNVLDSVINLLKTDRKDHDYIEVSQMDMSTVCECPKCHAKKEKYGGRFSGVWIEFLNRLLNDINPMFPNAQIRTLAFVNTLLPPKNIQVHKNIIIRLCEYLNDHAVPLEESDFFVSKEFMEALEGWNKLSNKVIIWMYTNNYHKGELIHPAWFAIAKDIKTYHKFGCMGSFFDLNYDTYNRSARIFKDFDKLKSYVHSKLSWDISLDTDKVINDFLRGFYGPRAAPYIRQYLDDAFRAVKLWPDPPLFVSDKLGEDVYMPLRTTFLDHGYKLWQIAIEEASKESDPMFLYNTQTGSLSHCMSIFLHRNRYDISTKWTLTSINNYPSQVIGEIARNVPQYCPDPYIPDPRSNVLCYIGKNDPSKPKGDNEDLFARAYFKFITEEATPSVLVCGDSKFASKEGLYCGRGGILQYNNWNYLEYNEGGFDFNFMDSRYISRYIRTGYHLNQTQEGIFEKVADQTYRLETSKYTINKKYTAEGNGVKGSFNIQFSSVPSTKSINTVVTVSCKLDDIGESFVSQYGDKWNKFTLYKEQKTSLFGLKDFVKSFNIYSPATKKGMNFVLSRTPDSISVEICRSKKAYKVYICFRDTNTASSSASVTITPLENTDIPQSMPEQKNEMFPYLQYDAQDFSFIDTPVNDGFNFHIGGDAKSKTGRAFIADYIGVNTSSIWTSPKYHIIKITKELSDYVHYGDIYNYSVHVRCDIANPNEDAFNAFYMVHTEGGQWKSVRMKNVSDYVWITHYDKYNTCHQHFYIQPMSGAKRCYIDEFRATPIKIAGDYHPYEPPPFTIKKLNPMPPVDLYGLNSTFEAQSNGITKTSIVVISVFFSLGAVIIIGAIVYNKFFKSKNEESDRSEITAEIIV